MFIYNLLVIFIFIFYLPVILFGKKSKSRFIPRIKGLPDGLQKSHKKRIWIHAVSVGEVKVGLALRADLREHLPEYEVIVSTVTKTGHELAKSKIDDENTVVYMPIDLTVLLNKLIDRINPSLFILIETEIWPNLISLLSKRGVPIIMVNGRISRRSYLYYRIVKRFLVPVLSKIDLFCMQTKDDAERIIHLGASRPKVKTTGNIKFDMFGQESSCDDSRVIDFKRRLDTNGASRLIVFGSTHEGEEKEFIGIFKELKVEFSNLKLIIAPRHIERIGDIESMLKRYGFVFLRVSEFPSKTNISYDIFLLDTIGELSSLYKFSYLVVMGGSFVAHGGHNILEPAFYSKCILFGPYMFNFKEISDLFLKNDAAIQCENFEVLKSKIRDLLLHTQDVQRLGNNAKMTLESNKGVLERTVGLIREVVYNNTRSLILDT